MVRSTIYAWAILASATMALVINMSLQQGVSWLGVRFYLLHRFHDNDPRREKTYLRGVANSTGADQPAHPRSQISAFVIRCLESTICKLATGEISIF